VNSEIPLTEKLVLNPSLIFQQKSFTIESKVDRGPDATGKNLYNTTTGNEKQVWMSLPIAIQYRIKPGKYNPYLAVGASADYLMSASMKIQTVQDDAGIVQEKTVAVKPQRKAFNISAIAAVGGKMRIFGGYFTAEARYHYGITAVNSKSTAFENHDLTFNNNLGDSTFKLSSLSVTIGYVQNIFNPKKLKRNK
jgi:hypothetical protein